MKDVVFLFGAGASAGAGCVLPERPPLGTGLFAELSRCCPRSWGSLPIELRAEFEAQAGFERGMGIVAKRYGTAVAPLLRDMAVYFIQFRPVDGQCLYNQLIRGLTARNLLSRIALSTLNYECILEFSLLQEGVEISYVGDGNRSAVPVWKLHGSCNMFSATVQASPDVLFSGVIVEGGVQAWLDASRVIEHCLTETGLAPVMSLYMEGKPAFTSPSDLKVIQADWAKAVAGARAVVCVGVRPHLPDTHIWDPILAAPATVLFAGDSDQFEQTIAIRSAGPSEFMGSRFNEGLPNILSRMEAICS